MRRLRNQATGLPVWWLEALMLVVLYYSYTGSRSAADASTGEAMRLGHDLLRLETFLHLDPELALNRWLQSVPVLAVICCFYYATFHFVVTPAMLVWMHRRHTSNYAQARWTLVVTTLICLCGFFLFPTAPPRLLTNTTYVDTMSHFQKWGWWSGGASAAPHGLESLTNQYAALPSLHCAWSMWCGFLLVRFGRRWPVRVLGALYPAATVFVVMATSNHYLLDAVAGWLVLAFAGGTVALVLRWRRSRRPGGPDASPRTTAPVTVVSPSGSPVTAPVASGAPAGVSPSSTPVTVTASMSPPSTSPLSGSPLSGPAPSASPADEVPAAAGEASGAGEAAAAWPDQDEPVGSDGSDGSGTASPPPPRPAPHADLPPPSGPAAGRSGQAAVVARSERAHAG